MAVESYAPPPEFIPPPKEPLPVEGLGNLIQSLRHEPQAFFDELSEELEAAREKTDGSQKNGDLRLLLETKDFSPSAAPSEVLTEEKIEACKLLVTRYFSEIIVGRPGMNCIVTAPHSVRPGSEEVQVIIMNKFPDANPDDIASLDGQIRQRRNVKPKSKIVNEIINERGEQVSDYVKEIYNLQGKFEAGTGVTAKEAARASGASCLLPSESRLLADLNRTGFDGKTLLRGVETVEYSFGALAAEWLATDLCIKKMAGIEGDSIKKPILHLSIHNTAKDPDLVGDIVIAGGMKQGKLPADPRVLRWVEGVIRSEIEKRNLEYSVGVAIEGQRWSGTIAGVQKRFGSSHLQGFGNDYHFVQIESTKDVRKHENNKVLQEILAEVMRRFSVEFASSDGLPAQPETEVDKHRQRGELYVGSDEDEGETIGRRNSNIKDVIWLNKSFRAALGVQVGENVLVNGQQFRVKKTGREEARTRKLILPSDVGLQLPLIIKKV